MVEDIRERDIKINTHLSIEKQIKQCNRYINIYNNSKSLREQRIIDDLNWCYSIIHSSGYKTKDINKISKEIELNKEDVIRLLDKYFILPVAQATGFYNYNSNQIKNKSKNNHKLTYRKLINIINKSLGEL